MKTFGIREFEAEVLYRRFRNLCNSLRFEAKKFALDHDLVFYGVAWDSKAIVEKAVAERDARIKELETELLESARLHGMGGERESVMKARVAELEKALVSSAEYFEMLEKSTGVEHGNLKEIRKALGKGE